MQQILQGLSYFHSLKKIHCDIKPENIFINDDHNDGMVIADFDVSVDQETRTTAGYLTSTATAVTRIGGAGTGTMGYMAPEIMDGESATTSSDMFSFGVLALKILFSQNDLSKSKTFKNFGGIIDFPLRIPAHSSNNNNNHLQSLLLKLLSQSKQNRLSADQALSHPYFNNLNEKIVTIKHNPPLYWDISSFDDASDFKEIDISAENITWFQRIVDISCIPQTLGKGRDVRTKQVYTKLKVTKVSRIENSRLMLKYLLNQHNVMLNNNQKHNPLDIKNVKCYDSSSSMNDYLNTNVNEVFLFHGTKPEHVEDIKHFGFDERSCKTEGTMLGSGFYFAENSSKSDQYVDSNPNQKKFYMFFSRVSLGSSYETANGLQKIKRAPNNCDSVIYSPASNSTSVYREFAVYDRTQCYPEFLIEYIRE